LFVIDDNLSNATTVLWASFQMHNGIAEYLTLKFKNHPSILSEYVKFLASNLIIEALGQLMDGLKQMGTEVKEVVRNILSAMKGGLTTCNKVEKVKTKLVAMEWRLVKLESKYGFGECEGKGAKKGFRVLKEVKLVEDRCSEIQGEDKLLKERGQKGGLSMREMC
jgi:hypothetical protein